MRKKILFGIGILLVCLAGWATYKITKPHRSVQGEPAIARLSAEKLYHDFEQSESLANEKWVGKVLEIRGIIESVSESGKYLSISLAGAAEGGVSCSVSKKELEATDRFSKGDPIAIKGKCTGFLMDVNMVDCVVEK